jgi:hypothetical protein
MDKTADEREQPVDFGGWQAGTTGRLLVVGIPEQPVDFRTTGRLLVGGNLEQPVDL